MPWIWEQENWPGFEFDPEIIADQERAFLLKSGQMFGSLSHVNEEDKDILRVNIISNEALKTSEIEGEYLNRESLQSSIRRNFGLKTDNLKSSDAERGVSEMMVDLYKNYNLEISHQSLHSWHAMLMKGRRDLQDIGAYRTHTESMQVVSGAMGGEGVHFEAPPSHCVHQEMSLFIDWFNQSQTSSLFKNHPLVRSAIAHLYFETIHPFEDGNGRIGRAVSEKALSQNLGRPTLISIAHAIESKKSDYYDALEQNNKTLEINDWLKYFADMVLRAQDYSQSLIDFLIEKGKFYRRFDGHFNERQAKVVERVFREGIEGFKGGLSANNYITITKAPRATATRDLQDLVAMGAFTKIGERRYTRYFLNINHPSVKASVK